jgi:PAS domain S-box-containing protein
VPELPFTQIAELAPDGLAIFSPVRDDAGTVVDFRYEWVNRPGAAALGRDDVGEVVGRTLVELKAAERGPALVDRYRAAYDAPPFAEQVVYRYDQRSGHFALHLTRIGEHLVMRTRDITDSVELASESRALLEQLERTFEHISDAVMILDHDWRFQFLNAQAERVLGRTRDELLGRDVWVEFPAAVGTDFEIVYRRVAETGQSESFEAYYPEPLETWYAVRAHAHPDGVAVFFEDVGPRRRMQERLQQAQRLESIATLAGGIAHDFNNLITVMNGHLALLREDLADDHPNRLDVEAIGEAAARAAELTRQMLTFSRRQILRPKLVDLNELLRREVPLVRRMLTDAHGLVTVLHREPVMVEVDPAEFDAALMAIVANAIDAMDPDGTLTLETSLVEVNARHPISPLVESGWFAVVAVSDDGRGMEPEVLQRAFEPFFTTKSAGHGTGLGLSVAHGMARQLGGDVTIYSEPGVGTTVRIYLPRSADDVPDPDDEPTVLPWGTGGDETVLVVDDNDSVRELIERVLSDSGYRVVAANDRGSALQVLERLGGAVDLLVTDVIMPGGSGHDLAVEVEQRHGPIPVLYVSGYTENSVIRHGIPVGDVEFLAKPFAPTELASAVRRVLDSTAAGDGDH